MTQETVELIGKDGGQAFTVGAELGVPGDIDQLFRGLEAGLKEHTGQTTLDILVNNAGETVPGTAPEEVSAEQFDRLFAVNAKAPFFIAQRALGLIPDGGRIINISSGLTRIASLAGRLRDVQGRARTALAALRATPRPRGFTVNSVLPGVTDNGDSATPDGRHGVLTEQQVFAIQDTWSGKGRWTHGATPLLSPSVPMPPAGGPSPPRVPRPRCPPTSHLGRFGTTRVVPPDGSSVA
ncbi:SDR family NAD(P)-dependent oxidoreductase [Streptomyces sp. LZ34]